MCCLTSLWLCAHLLLGRGFLMLPACPSPSFGLWVYWFNWLLFSNGVPYLRDGVTPAGSWTACPRSERRFNISIWVRYAGQFLAGHPASVLRVSARPVTQGMLPDGPHCVLPIRLTLALSRVLHGPLLGLSVASPTLARGLGLSFVPYPLFCWLGLVPRSVAQLCALQPLVPSFQVYLSEAVGFGGFLGSLLCAPLAVDLLPGSLNRLCPLSADCLLGLEPSPSGVASASAGRFSWHPGAVGALAVPSLRLRVSESSSLSAWSFPFRGM